MDIGPVPPKVPGYPAPVTTSEPAQQELAQNRELIQAVKALNEAGLLGQNNELTFALDRQTQRPVVRIVDRATGEVIRQIPPEYILQLANDLELLERKFQG